MCVYGVFMCIHVCTWLHVYMYEYMEAKGKGVFCHHFFIFLRNVITQLQTLEILFSDTSNFYISAGAMKSGHCVYIATL